MEKTKKTSLYAQHVKLGAKMAPFGGWMMPIQYEGIIKEHNATRERSGLFDVSHMGEIYVKGKDSTEFLESIVAQKLQNLKEGEAIYCQLPNKKGGLIDDLIIYNAKNIIPEVDYFIVINASRIDFDVPFMKQEAQKFDVEIINKSDDFSMIALQGPDSKFIIEKLGIDFQNQPKFFNFKNAKLKKIPVLLSRTGYTGEDGFEIILENEFAPVLWEELLNQGSTPVGLGARDTLRLEAGLPLYGHELNENTTPIESGLGFFVPSDKEKYYNGKEIILSQKLKQTPLRKKLFAFVMNDRQIARAQYPVYLEGKPAGVVTSGSVSPTTGKNIGFCLIEFENLSPDLVSKLNNPKEIIGMNIEIMVRNKLCSAKITKKPFIQKKYEK